MNKEQAVKYLSFSGFSDEQIKAIEGAFTCDKCVYSTSEGCQYDDITETIPPFDDCISRQAVLDAINTDWHEDLSQLEDAIKALPPVEPKTGHWIVDRSVDCYLDKVRCHCSECGKKKEFPADYDHIKQELSISYKYPEVIDNFCPNCGAKMVEPQEGEKINCKTTKCENCQNHNYCDYEPQESEEKPKSECEHDHEILKAYSDGANAVLDNVRAEIDGLLNDEDSNMYAHGVMDCLEIIDKFMAEGSEE